MKPLYPWAMLATNYDDVHVNWPMYVQPKLNGVRAKWDVQLKLLISRQGKVIPESVLPTLYAFLKRDYKEPHSLDGELWSHILSFQELCGAVNGKRKTPHEEEDTISLHAFDIISDKPSPRFIYDWPCKITTQYCSGPESFEQLKDQYTRSYFDGLILRVPGVPYIVGRTEALIKWKPWKYADVTPLNHIEGEGKFAGMLGAYLVKWNNKTFKVGGGNITEQERKEIWIYRSWIKPTIQIRYRELSRDGIPLQPQIVKL